MICGADREEGDVIKAPTGESHRMKKKKKKKQPAGQFHPVFVLQGSGLQLIIVVAFEGKGKAGTGSIVTALDEGEGQLSPDDAPLDAAQQFGLEINLQRDDRRVGIGVSMEARSSTHFPVLLCYLKTSSKAPVNYTVIDFYSPTTG